MGAPRGSSWCGNWARGGIRKRELERAVERLAERGELVELRSGHYVSTRVSRQYSTGRLNMHRDGYGFLIPDHPIEGLRGDIFIPPEASREGHAWRPRPGAHQPDRSGRPRGGRNRPQSSSARILRWWANSAFAGAATSWSRTTIAFGSGSRFPKAWRFRRSACHVGPRGRARRSKSQRVGDLDGMIVNVEIARIPRRRRRPVGRVVEILGHPDDFGVDVEIIIRKHHLPHRFPPEVIEQARSDCRARFAERRTRAAGAIFAALDIVTIDGETARDFDDAVWVERLDNGNYALQVHIADVSHYVRPGTPDRRRGAAARHQRLFPGSRRAHAAAGAFDRTSAR